MMKKLLVLPLAIMLAFVFVSPANAAVDACEGKVITTLSSIEGTTTTDTLEGVEISAGVTAFCADTQSSPCDASGANDPADILCEDLAGAYDITNGPQDEACWGPDDAWAATESGSGTVTSAAVSGTLSCTDKAANAIVSTITGDENAYIIETVSVAIVNTVFYFNIVSEALGSGNTRGIFVIRTGAGNSFWIWLLEDGGGNIDVRTRYTDTTIKNNDYDANLSTGTWYQIEIQYDSTGNTWQTWLNDVSMGSGAITSGSATQLRYGFSTEGNDTNALQMQLIGIAADDDTMPPACAGWSP